MMGKFCSLFPHLKYFPMTKLLPVTLLAFALACNTPSNEVVPAVEKSAEHTKHDYGVKFSFSSDFSIGDPALADKVVTLWKHYDANTVDSARSFFADSVFSDMPGYAAKLQADSMIKEIKASRSAFSSCVSTFDAIIPIKANDKNESGVAIWGVETTTKAGKTTKRDIHELWMFDQNGKINWIKQYQLER
jgi:hypothetical protein